MAEESNAWVFDSLIGFLHGPVWNAPLQTFIEEKSLGEFGRVSLSKSALFLLKISIVVFDPNESNDENNEEYKKIHDEYKHLVDYMLGTFMEEMQITPEQFEVACLAGKHTASGLSFHQGLFQQVKSIKFIYGIFKKIYKKNHILMKIWAANDIRIFVRMMTQRNVELQLQALDVIERRHLNSTASSSLDDPEVDDPSAGAIAKQQSVEETELDSIFQEEMK